MIKSWDKIFIYKTCQSPLLNSVTAHVNTQIAWPQTESGRLDSHPGWAWGVSDLLGPEGTSQQRGNPFGHPPKGCSLI